VSGTYFKLKPLLVESIIDYYYTQLVGNANCLPTIRAFATFTGGLGLIDGDPYVGANLAYGSTNVFWRQIRNFIIDMTLIPASSSATGIHWPTAQATSLQNIAFQMSSANGTAHQGVFIESGSGGFMGDLIFNGGLNGLNVGNQQFTMRNLTFNNAVNAINQAWDWGWTYKDISINNCTSKLFASTVCAGWNEFG
jgi:glucan 1,3-beta-glucosidase